MTIYEYNHLEEGEKLEAIWEHGEMVGDTIVGEYKIDLYKVFYFYVELYYHMENNVLIRLRSFSNTERLDTYSLI